ncbi:MULTISPECIES: hypothetical protein [Nocardiopsis]|uniref:Uncharacterized protein n=1 Tax=Nocardiopsis lambiniae TaxID=3075539 RepID=A0ABU2M5V3_9ACTN|nr:MULTISPECIES: hypothetical protein [unclassified Nocardiopsis]MDE3723046.1 hypothetical protein [Nocardiopsis sp. N85]MDT0328035.1 hypothetical protein [Nocardiopsis sp. DSM 44743]
MAASAMRIARIDAPEPAPTRALVLLPTPTAAVCGMCNGQRGWWETTDGQSPGKAIRRWIACSGCKGTGEV